MEPIATAPPYDVTALVARERRLLLDRLVSLTPHEWTRPTACPGWSVADVARHILGDDLGVIARLRDGHFGAVPPAGVADGDDLAIWVDRLNADWVDVTRRLSPRQLVAQLEAAGHELVELFGSRDPTVVDASVSWARPHLVPRWLDHARELTERWVHHRQIGDALDRPARDPDLDAATLATFRHAFVPTLEHHRPVRPTRARVTVTPPGPAFDWWWESGPDGWRTCGSAPEADGWISAPPDTMIRLLTNGLEPPAARALAHGGDPAIATTLLATRAIICVSNLADPARR